MMGLEALAGGRGRGRRRKRRRRRELSPCMCGERL